MQVEWVEVEPWSGMEWSGVELSGLLVAMIISNSAGQPGQQIVDCFQSNGLYSSALQRKTF